MEFVNLSSNDLITQLYESKGIDNIEIDESALISNPQEFLDAIEELRFKRIRINVEGILLCDYNFAIEIVKRGVRIFQVEFNHIIPRKHDESRGPESFKQIMKAIAEVYSASVDLDIPVIFQFVLNFEEPEYLIQAVEELSSMYPSQFKIEGDSPESKRAAELAISKGIWAER